MSTALKTLLLCLQTRKVSTKSSALYSDAAVARYSSGSFECQRYLAFAIQGGTEYLVLWAGYPKEEASWVKELDITRPALE